MASYVSAFLIPIMVLLTLGGVATAPGVLAKWQFKDLISILDGVQVAEQQSGGARIQQPAIQRPR